MSGSKTIKNRTSVPLQVTIVGRKGDSPGKDGRTVSASIAAGAQATLQYGDDQNPYMNVLAFSAVG